MIKKWLYSTLIVISFIILLFTRIYPYIDNNVPLGTDAGNYKYIMESYIRGLPNLPNGNIDLWIRVQPDPGLFIISDILHMMGFNIDAILKWVFIFFDILIGLGIYIVTNKFFEKGTGALAFFIYSISTVQLKVFWYLYYKNVIATFILLIAFYLLRSRKYIPFILTGSFLGGLHRATFLIFILTYISYILVYRKDFIKNVLTGIVIILLATIFYISYIKEAIIEYIEPIATANIGPGTFISLSDYYLSSLYYLPLGLLGLFILIKRRDFNILFFWFLINGIIVYFQLVFYNRFIIHLDIIIIILAALGLYEIIKFDKRVGIIVLIVMFTYSLFMIDQSMKEMKPLIGDEELEVIKGIDNITESNAFVMSSSRHYSPWIIGYSERRTIAPGVYDYDKWSVDEWRTFWQTGEKEEAINMLNIYEKPLYIYLGKKDWTNEKKFKNECFNEIFRKNRMKIYKLVC